MPSRNRYRTAAKFANHSAKFAGRIAEKSAIGLFRWATTDHLGTAKFLANMPPMGFLDTLTMILVTFVTGILGAIVAGFLMFLLIGFGIPLLFSL